MSPTLSLRREMRVRSGLVPKSLSQPLMQEDSFALARDAFLFTTLSGVRFYYRRGDGIVADMPNASLQDEFEIYLWGTVFGAVAWLNGFFPLHASAVVLDGRALAFSADSGGGKSTLATALSARGLPHLSDDTLPLAVSGEAVWAVPDGKPAKLWAQALALTSAEPQRPIASIPGKYYTQPPLIAENATPIGDLLVLAEAPDVHIERLRGPASLSALTAAMYRPHIPVALGDRSAHGEWLLRLAKTMRVWRLERPWQPGDPQGFGATTDVVVDALRALD